MSGNTNQLVTWAGPHSSILQLPRTCPEDYLGRFSDLGRVFDGFRGFKEPFAKGDWASTTVYIYFLWWILIYSWFQPIIKGVCTRCHEKRCCQLVSAAPGLWAGIYSSYFYEKIINQYKSDIKFWGIYSIKTYMLTSSTMDGFVMFRAFPTWVHWENCHPWWEFCRGWRFCWIIFETSTSCSTVLYSKPPKQIEKYNPNLKQWWFTFTFF